MPAHVKTSARNFQDLTPRSDPSFLAAAMPT